MYLNMLAKIYRWWSEVWLSKKGISDLWSHLFLVLLRRHGRLRPYMALYFTFTLTYFDHLRWYLRWYRRWCIYIHIYIYTYVYMYILYTYHSISYRWYPRWRIFQEKCAKFYVAGTVFAFEHLHGKKIIFRDLKPAISSGRREMSITAGRNTHNTDETKAEIEGYIRILGRIWKNYGELWRTID